MVETITVWFEIEIPFDPITPDKSVAVARTVTVPSLTAVKRPPVLMEADPEPLITVQITDLLVALAGRTVASIWSFPPLVVIVDAPASPLTEMEVTNTGGDDFEPAEMLVLPSSS